MCSCARQCALTLPYLLHCNCFNMTFQVFSCFTDMVEDASGANQPMAEGRINVRFRRLQPDEDRALATCNILVRGACMLARCAAVRCKLFCVSCLINTVSARLN